MCCTFCDCHCIFVACCYCECDNGVWVLISSTKLVRCLCLVPSNTALANQKFILHLYYSSFSSWTSLHYSFHIRSFAGFLSWAVVVVLVCVSVCTIFRVTESGSINQSINHNTFIERRLSPVNQRRIMAETRLSVHVYCRQCQTVRCLSYKI